MAGGQHKDRDKSRRAHFYFTGKMANAATERAATACPSIGFMSGWQSG